MSWQGYVDSIMADGGNCKDAAVVGYTENKYVWASVSGGELSKITADQIDSLVSQDRSSFFITGLGLGSYQCSVLRDALCVDGDGTMDLRTKNKDGGCTYSVAVAKSSKALVFAMGKEGVAGGTLNVIVYKIADYLRKQGY
ncbi:profilin-2-like [Corythoichthys intestinalis]|uniref:profilin-2-like n=1 Tax=Corythoichthys intestinalis TaxID=161448 RepID=UPI0025A56840|nr:profilin-2-like [Corythoichthys intestinalis]XP_061791160.1 profilin-2-like [Nerophis lumbriciformis]